MEFWCWFEYQWPNFVIFSFLLLILVKKYRHVRIKKNRTENNEAESSVLVEQDRRSKR